MIIALGLFIPSVLFLIVSFFIVPIVNKKIKDGNYKEYFREEDITEMFKYYIIALCSAQYIWG